MGLIDLLKGVWNKMIAPKTLESALHIAPTISPIMKEKLELWERMYQDDAPWLSENVKSLGLPAMIAAEKARTATIEMEIKITGESERAKFIEKQFEKVLSTIRENLEFGIAMGGLVIKPYPVKGIDGKYVLEFNYTKAVDFFPLSFSPEGKITEAAFVDRIIAKDKVYSKVEYHKLEGTKLIVRNLAYEQETHNGIVPEENLGTPIPLTNISAWESIEPIVEIENVDTLLFAYFRMPQANTVDLHSPLGVSGFSRAETLIRDADLQYSNLLWEFEGGQLAVDVDRTALNPMRDSKGKETLVLPKLQERLYRHNLDLGDDDVYNVFSPQLRDASIINGLNNILMHIEDVCELSRGTLSTVSYTEARTATELRILKQRSFAANADVQKELERTLSDVIDIMDKYCNLYEIVDSGDYEVAYKWDDSIIVDKDSERQIDLMDLDKGLLSRVEYRMKWFGETEKQAEKALKKIDEEKKAAMEMQQSIVMNNQLQQNNTSSKSEAQASYEKNKRANESTEKRKNTSNDD